MVDYNRDLKIASDGDRKEFLADVSSFANAAGGTLLFGIEEEDGYPTGVRGIEIASEDDLLLRVESMVTVRDGIAPRLSVESRVIHLEGGSGILAIRVPLSWWRPLMVTFGGHGKFYGRSTRGKLPMDVQQIREAFLLSEEAAERVRRFRIDRVAQIVAGQPVHRSMKEHASCCTLFRSTLSSSVAP